MFKNKYKIILTNNLSLEKSIPRGLEGDLKNIFYKQYQLLFMKRKASFSMFSSSFFISFSLVIRPTRRLVHSYETQIWRANEIHTFTCRRVRFVFIFMKHDPGRRLNTSYRETIFIIVVTKYRHANNGHDHRLHDNNTM